MAQKASGPLNESAAESANPRYLPMLMSSPASPTLGGCPMFPGDNIWNRRVDTVPVHPKSSQYVGIIGSSANVHADFGEGLWEGFPMASLS